MIINIMISHAHHGIPSFLVDDEDVDGVTDAGGDVVGGDEDIPGK